MYVRVIWGFVFERKIDGMKSNDGASLFIYTGSGCPGAKNCISDLGETTKPHGCTITSSTIYKLYNYS